MRWKTNPEPVDLERRTVKYFAALPTKLDDGYTVWFENYWAKEEYCYLKSDDTGYWKLLSTSTEHPDKPNTGSSGKPSWK